MPRRSTKARRSGPASFTRSRTKAKAEALSPSPSAPPYPLVFPSDALPFIFCFLGTAEDLGAASLIDRGWKAAGDEYWTRKENQEEPWFSTFCERFSTEVMGTIVEVMKEKKDWLNVQEEEGQGGGQEGDEEEDNECFYDKEVYLEVVYREGLDGYHNASDSEGDEETAGSLLFSMTPKNLWYKSCRAHQNAKWRNTRGKGPVPAQFKSPFPGMFLRIELREDMKGEGGVGQLFGCRTFPFSDDNLLLALYDESGVSFLEVIDELPDVRLRLTLTMVDLVGGRVVKLVEADGYEDDGNCVETECYGFTPRVYHPRCHTYYLSTLHLSYMYGFPVLILIVLLIYPELYPKEESEFWQEFSNVNQVKMFVQGAFKDMFC